MLGKRPAGLPEGVFVHPLAFVESAAIGNETRVWAFAHVMKGSTIGERCNLGEQVFIESGAVVGNGVTVKNGISIWDLVTIEDDVFLGPHMVFTNDPKPRAFIKLGHDSLVPTRIRKGATIGAGATLVCGVTIGQYAFVAAGAVVTRNVPDFGLVKGNPAKLSSYICRCTRTRFSLPAKSEAACSHCGTANPQIQS